MLERARTLIDRHGRWLLPALLVVASVAPFLPAVSGEFLRDDIPYVEMNPSVTVRPWAEAFTQTFPPRSPHGLYRPVTTLTFIVDHALYGEGTTGYHVTNLMLHAACVLLLFALLRRLGLAPFPSFAGCLLFALHPTHAEAVCWISARSEPLAFALGVGALVVGASGDGLRQRIVAALLLLAAMLAKESGLVFAPLAIVLAWRSTPERRWPRLADVALPAAAIVAGLLVRFVAVGGLGLDAGLRTYDLGLFDRLLLGIRLAGHDYVLMTLWPGAMRAEYPILFDGGGTISLPLFLGAAVLGLWGWGMGRAWRAADRRLVFALVWAPLTLLPYLHVLSSIGETAAQRFLFAPSAALAFAVALGWERLARRAPWTWAGLGVLLLVALIVTILRAGDWRSESDLWGAELDRHPDAPKANLWEGSRRDDGGLGLLARLDEVLEVYPEHPEILYRRALLTAQLRRDFRGAHVHAERLAEIHPDYIGLKTLRAAIAMNRGRRAEGLQLLEEARGESRWDPVCRIQLAQHALRMRQWNRAEVLVREALPVLVLPEHHASLEWAFKTLEALVEKGAIERGDVRRLADEAIAWMPAGDAREAVKRYVR